MLVVTSAEVPFEYWAVAVYLAVAPGTSRVGPLMPKPTTTAGESVGGDMGGGCVGSSESLLQFAVSAATAAIDRSVSAARGPGMAVSSVLENVWTGQMRHS